MTIVKTFRISDSRNIFSSTFRKIKDKGKIVNNVFCSHKFIRKKYVSSVILNMLKNYSQYYEPYSSQEI